MEDCAFLHGPSTSMDDVIGEDVVAPPSQQPTPAAGEGRGDDQSNAGAGDGDDVQDETGPRAAAAAAAAAGGGGAAVAAAAVVVVARRTSNRAEFAEIDRTSMQTMKRFRLSRHAPEGTDSPKFTMQDLFGLTT